MQKYKYRNAKLKEKKKILSLISTFNASNTKTLLIIKQILENSKALDLMKEMKIRNILSKPLMKHLK